MFNYVLIDLFNSETFKKIIVSHILRILKGSKTVEGCSSGHNQSKLKKMKKIKTKYTS